MTPTNKLTLPGSILLLACSVACAAEGPEEEPTQDERETDPAAREKIDAQKTQMESDLASGTLLKPAMAMLCARVPFTRTSVCCGGSSCWEITIGRAIIE